MSMRATHHACLQAMNKYMPMENATVSKLWNIASTYNTDDDEEAALVAFRAQVHDFRPPPRSSYCLINKTKTTPPSSNIRHRNPFADLSAEDCDRLPTPMLSFRPSWPHSGRRS